MLHNHCERDTCHSVILSAHKNCHCCHMPLSQCPHSLHKMQSCHTAILCQTTKTLSVVIMSLPQCSHSHHKSTSLYSVILCHQTKTMSVVIISSPQCPHSLHRAQTCQSVILKLTGDEIQLVQYLSLHC